MMAVGIRKGSMTPHLIESLYFAEIYRVLILTMTMESPIALLYSMISGRNPIVIMVVPKPSPLWTAEPARTTSITYKVDETDIFFPLYRPDDTDRSFDQNIQNYVHSITEERNPL